jgi:hypothetical protein
MAEPGRSLSIACHHCTHDPHIADTIFFVTRPMKMVRVPQSLITQLQTDKYILDCAERKWHKTPQTAYCSVPKDVKATKMGHSQNWRNYPRRGFIGNCIISHYCQQNFSFFISCQSSSPFFLQNLHYEPSMLPLHQILHGLSPVTSSLFMLATRWSCALNKRAKVVETRHRLHSCVRSQHKLSLFHNSRRGWNFIRGVGHCFLHSSVEFLFVMLDRFSQKRSLLKEKTEKNLVTVVLVVGRIAQSPPRIAGPIARWTGGP